MEADMLKKILVQGLIGFLLMASVAFAMQAAAAPSAPASVGGISIPPISLGGGVLSGIISGAIGAALAVFVGRTKSPDPVTGQLEPFNLTMAWETALIGVIVGGVAGYFHKAPADIATFLTTSPLGMAIVTGAEQVWNLVFRNSAPIIGKGLRFLLAGAGANPTAPPPGTPPKP
jgi:hypothetical protein